VPGAERVRFMMTGTETTALAIRVARAVHRAPAPREVRGRTSTACTTRVMAAVKDPFEIPVSAGVPTSTLATTLVARQQRPTRT